MTALLTTALVSLFTQCTSAPMPRTERDARESACRIMGGEPRVLVSARCTTARGSCVWTRRYQGCTR